MQEEQSTGHYCPHEVQIIYTLQMEKQSPLSPDHYSGPRLPLHLNLQSLGHESLAYHTRHWKLHKRTSKGKMASIENQQFAHELLPTSLCSRWCGMKRDWEPNEPKIIYKQNFHLGLYRPTFKHHGGFHLGKNWCNLPSQRGSTSLDKCLQAVAMKILTNDTQKVW